MGQHLLTIVHISDLHLAVPLMSGLTPLGPQAPQPSRYIWPFTGKLGHSHEALVQLTDLFRDLCDPGEQLALVTTGDLTAHGASVQFDVAEEFLTGWLPDPGTGTGKLLGGAGMIDPKLLPTGIASNLQTAIPGNHDHWPGTGAIRGAPVARLSSMFPPPQSPTSMPFPCQSTVLPLGSARKLILIRLNSDAEVGHNSAERFWGRADFVQQCDHARTLLGKRPDDDSQIRVLLVHHSWIHNGMVLGIPTNSRNALHQLIKETGIEVLLTGHMHTADVQMVPLANCTFVECRCGTSTQLDFYPRKFLNDWSKHTKHWKLPTLDQNTVLEHRLEEDGAGVRWTTTQYERDLNNGFSPSKKTYPSFLLPL